MTDMEDYLAFSVRDFATATADKRPTPGGGTVAGVVGALATALGEMVLNFTRGKKAFAEYSETHEALSVRLARSRGMFADLTADDAAAYTLYTKAAKCNDETKESKMATALTAAIDVPRQMTALAISVLENLIALGEHCNKYLLTDLAAAAVLAEAVIRMSDYNVRVNANNLPDQSAAADLRKASARDRQRAAQLRETVEKIVSEYV